jgi:hypothetical protein
MKPPAGAEFVQHFLPPPAELVKLCQMNHSFIGDRLQIQATKPNP